MVDCNYFADIGTENAKKHNWHAFVLLNVMVRWKFDVLILVDRCRPKRIMHISLKTDTLVTAGDSASMSSNHSN